VFQHPTRSIPASPKQKVFLKFSTQGRPSNYSFVVCRKDGDEVHIRHQLRVATNAHTDALKQPANLVLDVAVIRPLDVSDLATNDYVSNNALVTFGEAKHMSAFAELIAGFIGVTHELQPQRLNGSHTTRPTPAIHVAPFLYVSGYLNRTALGIQETISNRGYDIAIYSRIQDLVDGLKIPEMVAPEKKRRGRRSSLKPRERKPTVVPI
jgi:hypothetical protein